MNSRIRLQNDPIFSFKEKYVYDRDRPYIIRRKRIDAEDVAPLHYSGCMEILVCTDIDGVAVIEGHRVELSGNTVVVIPPEAIHAVTLHPGESEYVLQVSFDALKAYIDVPELFGALGIDCRDLCYICPEYDAILPLARKLFEEDEDFFACLTYLFSILELVSRHVYPGEKRAVGVDRQQETLQRLITWTVDNHDQSITLADAAGFVGFSKNYFCTWFKSMTRTTYNDHLRDTRLAFACKDLVETRSVSDACFKCGFQDLSYFIQSFKKKYGCTPKKYIEQFSSRAD